MLQQATRRPTHTLRPKWIFAYHHSSQKPIRPCARGSTQRNQSLSSVHRITRRCSSNLSSTPYEQRAAHGATRCIRTPRSGCHSRTTFSYPHEAIRLPSHAQANQLTVWTFELTPGMILELNHLYDDQSGTFRASLLLFIDAPRGYKDVHCNHELQRICDTAAIRSRRRPHHQFQVLVYQASHLRGVYPSRHHFVQKS